MSALRTCSVIRMTAPVPSSNDLKSALKIVSVSQFLKMPETLSYKVDDSNNLVDFMSAEIQNVKSLSKPDGSEENNDDIVALQPLSSIEGDILVHLSDFLLKPIV